jgi:hypothetical protein
MNAKFPPAVPWRASAAFTAGVLLLAAACNSKPPAPAVSTDEKADPSDAPGTPIFHNVTAQSGVVHTYENGEWRDPQKDHYAIPESLGGGGGAADFFGTGRMDLFICGGGWYDRTHSEYVADKSKLPGLHGHPWKLYKNMGNFQFVDVTKEVGLDKLADDKEIFYNHGIAICDYDRDGWPDILVTGWHRVALYHNEPDGKGGRKFVDVAAKAGLPEGLWTTSAAWADLDGDGWPDLYVCQYVDWSFESNHPIDCTYDGKQRDVCPPKKFTALPHHVFRNNGNGTFTDVSLDAGIRMPRTQEQYNAFEAHIRAWLKNEHSAMDSQKQDERVSQWLKRLKTAQEQKEYGKGLGVIIADVNNDGRPDVYVANDTVDNFLYMNRSRPGRILLEELGLETGTARDNKGQPEGSMGVAVCDFNRSGLPSIWVVNYEAELHALYKNECKDGKEFFLFATESTGISAIGQAFVGWGTTFMDLYHRGWEDIFVSNGHAIRHPTGKAKRAQRPLLMQNLGTGKNNRVRFVDITERGGDYFTSVHQGRGAVFADFDNDGRIDMALIHLSEPVAVVRNEAETQGNHWLGLDLRGKKNADVVGARIFLELEDGMQSRYQTGGGSYASSADRRHVFGLGKADKIGKLTVVWPNNEKQTWSDLAVDRYWRLTDGEKEAKELPKK